MKFEEALVYYRTGHRIQLDRRPKMPLEYYTHGTIFVTDKNVDEFQAPRHSENWKVYPNLESRLVSTEEII